MRKDWYGMPEQATGNKGRVLFLERYMMEHTDDDHVVTTDELIHIYEENGYKANRNTIRDDVATLNAAGIEILSERVGNGKAYHIGARLFEMAELKMLVDAVSSSRFITMGKSETLIGKLAKLTNEENRATLTARIFTADRIKTSNTAVFNTTDTICRAMEEGKKIRFHYWNYNPQKEHVLRHEGDWFIASPHALIWNDDRYYVAAYSDFREKVVNFRVDRMCDVEVTDDPAVKDDGFNPSDYTKSTIKMLDDDLDEIEVTLACDNPFMQNIVDRFGEEVETEVVDEDSFKASVTVRPSKTFFSWVVGFCGGIRIAEPADVKERFEETLRMVLFCQSAI